MDFTWSVAVAVFFFLLCVSLVSVKYDRYNNNVKLPIQKLRLINR